MTANKTIKKNHRPVIDRYALEPSYKCKKILKRAFKSIAIVHNLTIDILYECELKKEDSSIVRVKTLIRDYLIDNPDTKEVLSFVPNVSYEMAIVEAINEYKFSKFEKRKARTIHENSVQHIVIGPSEFAYSIRNKILTVKKLEINTSRLKIDNLGKGKPYRLRISYKPRNDDYRMSLYFSDGNRKTSNENSNFHRTIELVRESTKEVTRLYVQKPDKFIESFLGQDDDDDISKMSCLIINPDGTVMGVNDDNENSPIMIEHRNCVSVYNGNIKFVIGIINKTPLTEHYKFRTIKLSDIGYSEKNDVDSLLETRRGRLCFKYLNKDNVHILSSFCYDAMKKRVSLRKRV